MLELEVNSEAEALVLAEFSCPPMEPTESPCVIARHETTLFSSEHCVWRELRGSALRGADTDQTAVRSAFSSCVSPFWRRCALAPCPFAAPAIVIGTACQVAPLRIPTLPRSASQQNGVMAPRTRAAIKPSLTLTRLTLPRCTQAPLAFARTASTERGEHAHCGWFGKF